MNLLAYTRCYFYFDLAMFIIWITAKTDWLWVFPVCDSLTKKSKKIAEYYNLNVVMWKTKYGNM